MTRFDEETFNEEVDGEAIETMVSDGIRVLGRAWKATYL